MAVCRAYINFGIQTAFAFNQGKLTPLKSCKRLLSNRIFRQASNSTLTSLQPSGPTRFLREFISVPVAASPPTTEQAPPSPPSPSMAPVDVRHIPSKGLYVSTPTSWLESRFHFSFAEYYNPANSNFGVLRVLNDDLVQPNSGFGRHPHRNMEIVTYVVDGNLTHKDSMGTEETLGRGSVQYMSAGTGVTHSEMNNCDELLRFLQIWILPNSQGLKPNYGSRSFPKDARHNKFQQVVTSFGNLESEIDTGTGLIPIHQDAAMYVTELDPGVSQTLELRQGRQVYGVCIEGYVTVDGGKAAQSLAARDAFEVVNLGSEVASITFSAGEEAGTHVFVIEMSAK